MNTERVEAAAKALRELEGEKQTPWEELDYRIKTVWIGRALAAITAADAASGERISIVNRGESTIRIGNEVYKFSPGEELVVRKVRTA
jgi:hypothetical protein